MTRMLQFQKRMLLAIKKSKKCACAMNDGGVGTRSFIFLSGKLLYYVCDYSGKFLKRLCSSGGIECPSTANFYHQRGQ